MSTPEELETAVVRRWPLRRLRRGTVLVVGVVLVPLALMLLFTSYHTVTEESAVRQAFAGVAGQTIAIVSSLTAVAMTVAARKWRELPLFSAVAIAVCALAATSLSTTGDQLVRLLSGLG